MLLFSLFKYKNQEETYMFKKVVAVLIFMSLVIFSFTLFVYAEEPKRWEKPEEHPSPYAGREYTREHWTRFWVNETGTDKGANDAELIGQGYCSVFDIPGSLAYGYVAVTSKDLDLSERPFNFDLKMNVVPKFLEAFNFNYDNTVKAYPCSPAWYKENGYENAGLYMSNQSGCLNDVPVKKTTGDSYTGQPGVPREATINNPACLKINDPPADVAGGYDGNRKMYWYAKKGDQWRSIW